MPHPLPSHPFLDICHARTHTQTNPLSEWYEKYQLKLVLNKGKKILRENMEIQFSA